MKRVAVLGSTGSVGENAVKVISALSDRFQVAALSAGRNYQLLAEQVRHHGPRMVAVAGEEERKMLRALLGPACPEVLIGEDGLCRLAELSEAETIVIAVAGSAAIAPALAAARAGKTLALANKECLVMAGELILKEVTRTGARLLPVDSEHSGVFQALADRPRGEVKRILLPASGGPFLDHTPDQLERVTPEQALRHPTWSMGKKISVDSATLMNKALEIIEARWLFDLPPAAIEVIIHPESVLHALVELTDGSVIAQLSPPDMRLPILHALAWPERVDADLPRLNLAEIGRLTFRPLNHLRFPAPLLAYQALAKGGTTAAVLAAADEAAVQAFLDGRLPFNKIVPLVGEVLSAHATVPLQNLDQVRALETWATREILKRVKP